MLGESKKVTLLQNKALLSSLGEGDHGDLHLFTKHHPPQRYQFVKSNYCTNLYALQTSSSTLTHCRTRRNPRPKKVKFQIAGLHGRTSVHHQGLRGRAWKGSTCAKAEPSPRRAPGAQPTAHATRILHPGCFSPPKKKSGGGQDEPPGVLSQVLGVGSGPGWTPGNPEKPRARPGRGAPRPPRAPPGRPAPGTLPAPGARTHRSRSPAAEPGSGGPRGCCMPSGPCATRRPGAGLRPGAGSSGGRDGPAAARLLSSGSGYTPGAQGKFGGARGWRRRGGGAASPPCPALPPASDCSHGRAPPTGEARWARRGSPADALLPGTGPQEGGRPGAEVVPSKGSLAPTGLNKAIPQSPVLKHCPLSLSPLGREMFEVAPGKCSPHPPSQGRQAHCQAKCLL